MDVSISSLCTTVSHKDRNDAEDGKCGFRCIQCVAYRLSVFTSLLRTVDRKNTKLGEGVNHLL